MINERRSPLPWIHLQELLCWSCSVLLRLQHRQLRLIQQQQTWEKRVSYVRNLSRINFSMCCIVIALYSVFSYMQERDNVSLVTVDTLILLTLLCCGHTHTLWHSKNKQKSGTDSLTLWLLVIATQQQTESAGKSERHGGRQTEVTHQSSRGIGTSALIDHSPVVIGSQNEFLHRQIPHLHNVEVTVAVTCRKTHHVANANLVHTVPPAITLTGSELENGLRQGQIHQAL
ncbi:hypothetical protein PAMP_007887 [Pampus punctatissimus]